MRLVFRSTLVIGMIGAAWSGLAAQAQRAAGAPPAHDPGIYLVTAGKSGGEDLVKLHGSMMQLNQPRPNMAKMMFGGSMPNASGELVGENADYRITDTSPTFVFYFSANAGQRQSQPPPPPDMNDPNAMLAAMRGGQAAMLDAPPQQAKSAEEFNLVKFDVKDGKRSADLGKIGEAKGVGKSKNKVGATVERVQQGVYRVHASNLQPGEYGFYWAGGGGGGQGGGSFWDFGIDVKK